MKLITMWPVNGIERVLYCVVHWILHLHFHKTRKVHHVTCQKLQWSSLSAIISYVFLSLTADFLLCHLKLMHHFLSLPTFSLPTFSHFLSYATLIIFSVVRISDHLLAFSLSANMSILNHIQLSEYSWHFLLTTWPKMMIDLGNHLLLIRATQFGVRTVVEQTVASSWFNHLNW